MCAMALSENTVLQKTRVDNLKHVKNLNLWGNDLQDVSLLRDMPNVEVLSLSVNKIDSLRDFAACPKLQELYLRKNDIRNLEDVRYLKNLRLLKILWLCDNPCADTPGYRTFVVWHLPQLEKLDNVDVTPQERQAAQRMSEEEVTGLAFPGGMPKPRAPVAPQEIVEHARAKYAAPAAPEAPHPPPARERAANPTPPPAHPSAPPSAAFQAPGARNSGAPEVRGSRPPSSARSTASQKNIMTAILSLLNELTDESMEIIHQEISDRLGVQ
jgi:hypothetical protein